ncbi:trafficking protein particle complex subunit 13 isoform X2 [Hemicordylus capensis]|uniref:trafficking protein particle complex subunit 13 isoform X2 n=1 Tax=Hemicordylus capensis TaxID=884348 RepID=UPI00230402D0|nr:trafficking protein particle complex subunit 13 isoform X2 [Hemicordylus capensis]
MEVVLHYRAWEKDPTVLQKITEEALKEFPVRQLPSFIPWFPNDCKLPLKPKQRPPVISAEEAGQVQQHLATPETVCSSPSYDCTEGLQEFHPNTKAGQCLQAECGGNNVNNFKKQSACDRQKLKRSWSVSVPNSKLKDKILPLSEELRSSLEKLKLHAFYRGQWLIEPSTFNNQTLEDIWIKLNRMIKHNELPSCNATIQRLMRLTKPTLFTNIPVTCEERDLPGDLFNQLMKDDPSTVKGAETLMLGEMLTLPQNFGNIFLGETFSSYISVHNDSHQVVKDILVKADLQTSSQRLNLSASSSAVAELKQDCCIDDVIHHEVKEIGTHILVCAVSYTTQTGEKMYFRKFFKFQVLKPLDVKTKFYNAESDLSSVTDEVFLEAQIQNITTSPMFMEKVSLEPSMMYNVAELNAVGQGGESLSTFGTRTYLQPMDTRQYLYCLKPKQEFAEKAGVIKGVTVIGKLDIVWKTNLGERGRLQTSQLQRMAPGYGDVRLSLETIPDTVNLEEPFEITCKITNCSERTMDLVLEMCNTNSIHWCGVSGRQLGKLHPTSSLHLTLTLLSSVQGLQSVSGLRLTDTFLKRTYEYDDIAQVCVVSSKIKEN